MQVSLVKFTQAMNKVRRFAEGQKNVPGVLLDINGDRMDVCYSDGKKSIIEKIDIENPNSEINGKIVVPYIRIMGIVDSCQPSGMVETGDLTITAGEGSTLIVTALKKVKLVSKKDTGNTDLEGNVEQEEVVEEKIVSKFEQKIPYYKPEDNIQYGVLSRMNYDSIFEFDSADVWPKAEFSEILQRASTEKSKIIYISSTKKAAFVANLAHLTNIPTMSCIEHGLTVSTNIAGALVEILSKTAGDKITVHVVDSRYANIVSEDNNVGIWFELAPPNKTDVITLTRYQEKKYDTYNMVFLRAALQNVVSCAMAADSNEKTTLQFTTEEGAPSIKISTVNSGASTANVFNVVLERYKDSAGNLATTKIPVNLKVLHDMLNNCKQYYVAVDISGDDTGMYIRIGDIEKAYIDETTKEPVNELGITHYSISAR